MRILYLLTLLFRATRILRTFHHLSSLALLTRSSKRSDVQALTPLTIKQCLEATQAHSDAELCIDGIEVGQLTVVAQVLTIARQVTNRVYFLDDATGRIEARSFIDPSSDTGSERDDEEIPCDTNPCLARKKLTDGFIVRVRTSVSLAR